MSDRVRQFGLTSDSTLVGVAYSFRPWQWYKQLIVLVPIAFSLQYFDELDPSIWASIFAGVALFCTTAGAIYVLNDVSDVEEDRNHPEKKHRPIASGQVSVPLAVGVVALVLPASLLSAWWLHESFAVVLLAYVVQNLAYSYLLKQFVFVDLILIGMGFVLRAIAGVVLVDAPMSSWLVLCAFLTALMLGIGKRQAELAAAATEDAGGTRPSLESYSQELLSLMFISVAAALLIAYSLYTFFVRQTGMMLTIPFAFYAIFRYSYLTVEDRMERPELMFLDTGMVVNLVAWMVFTMLILYVLPALEAGLLG